MVGSKAFGGLNRRLKEKTAESRWFETTGQAPFGRAKAAYWKIKGQRIRAKGPMCSYAFTDAATHALQSTTRRLSPWLSSEACGSSAPLPSPLRNLPIANAVWRCNMSETVRPSFWPKRVKALHDPGFFFVCF